MKVKKFFAYFILGIIVLVFVFLGVDPTSIGVRRGGVAASINKKSISVLDYQRALEGMRARWKRESAEDQDLSEEQEKRLRVQALNDLVSLELIKQEAERVQFFISKKEIIDTLVNIPLFQDKKVFRRENYLNFLRLNRQTASEFESNIEKQMLRQRFFNYFQKSLGFTELEKDRKNQVDQVQLDLEFIGFEISKLKDKKSYESLKQALMADHVAGVEDFVKKNQLNWKATGKFGLNVSEIPQIIGSESLLKALLTETLKGKKFLNQPLPFLNKVYVFKIKTFTDSKDSELQFFNEFQYFFQMSLVESIFSNWLNSLKEKASVRYYIKSLTDV